MATKTKTTVRSTSVLGISATVSVDDAAALGVGTVDAESVAAVAAFYVVKARGEMSVRDYADRTGISSSRVGRMTHIGAHVVAIGPSATLADARNVTHVVNGMGTADITTAVAGRKGRSLAGTFGTLAKQVSTDRAQKREPRPASEKKDKKGAKGTPTPDQICADLLPMLRHLISNPPTAEAFSPVESAVGDILSAILSASSNRNARTGS